MRVQRLRLRKDYEAALADAIRASSRYALMRAGQNGALMRLGFGRKYLFVSLKPRFRRGGIAIPVAFRRKQTGSRHALEFRGQNSAFNVALHAGSGLKPPGKALAWYRRLPLGE